MKRTFIVPTAPDHDRSDAGRFRGVFDGFVDYDSVVTTSIIASNTIGER
jgi:hypothetical protein